MRELWDVTKAVAYRNIRNSITRPAVMFPPMIIPLVFFGAFAGGLSALGRAPGFDFPSGYTSFQFVFVWVQGSAFHGMFVGFTIARDYESGFARRLMLAAPNRFGIVGGYVAATVLRAMVGAVVLFGVGFAAGVQVDGSIIELAGLVLMGLGITVLTSLWGAGLALRFRTIQAGPLMQVPIFVGMFLAPVFVPLALLTGWIRTTANANPFTVFLEEGRALISGTDPRVLVLAAVSLAAIAVMTLWASGGLRAAARAG